MNGGVFISPLKVNTSYRMRDRGRIGNAYNVVGAHTTSAVNEEPLQIIRFRDLYQFRGILGHG